jgi:AcrR family transcriptional regulator
MLDMKISRQVDRRPQILDAAERCFAQAGFHRTTMQDVARDAGMVPGNLYRYFPSKNAIIAGLIERDRAELAADFACLSGAPNLMEAFKILGRKHFADQPREKSLIALQIWSEAALDPQISALVGEVQMEVRNGIMNVCSMAKKSGQIHEDVELDALARLILTLSDGLIRRRAIDPDFDCDCEVENTLCLIGAVLEGAVKLSARIEKPLINPIDSAGN